MNTYKRNCPICDSVIEYTNKRSWYNAKKAESSCKTCWKKKLKDINSEKIKNGTFKYHIRDREKEKTLDRPYKRNCPNCGGEMSYASKKTLNTAINDNTMCNGCSTKIHNKGVMNGLTNEQTKQMRATKAGFSSWEEYVENYPKKQFYKREVWRHTYKHDLEKLEHWEKRGRCGVDGAYQLDHIISVNEGWETGIPAEEIAKWENLRMIPWKKNRKKSDKRLDIDL